MSTTLTAYLSFDGRTREAFAFYEQVLKGRIDAMLSYDDAPRPPESASGGSGCGDAPMPTGPGILHACLTLPGGAMLMAGDMPPGVPFEGVKGAMLALSYDTVAEAESVFAGLAEGGQVTMPLSPTFWSRTFGMLTDRWGISWAVNGEPVPMGQEARA